MLRKLKPLGLLSCLFVLTACASTARETPTSATSAACLALHPLTFSRNDTPQTKELIRSNNAALRAICSR